MDEDLTVVEELRAKLAEKKLDREMIADLKAKLAVQPPDEETAEALRTLLLTQALDEKMMTELTALQREYMPEPPRELSDDELDNVVGGCGEDYNTLSTPDYIKQYPVKSSSHMGLEVWVKNSNFKPVYRDGYWRCPHHPAGGVLKRGYDTADGKARFSCKTCNTMFAFSEPFENPHKDKDCPGIM